MFDILDVKYDSFENYHPVVNFVYFTSVLLFSMFFMHPVFQIISLMSALSYMFMLKGFKEGLKFNLKFMLPILVLMAILNPILNHEGATMLFYLKSGNPVTLESIIYGAAAGVMFITVIAWFSSYNSVMTSDKVMHLFGSVIPSLSLVFSMVLRFVPRYSEQIKKISESQKAIGRDVSQGNIFQRARNGITILSIMITWALENSIETADSMRSRGYGLPGRTSFSIFRYDKRDKIALVTMFILITIILIGAYYEVNTIKFFPMIKIKEINFFSIIVYISYLILCLIPVIINIQEALKWKYIESKI